MVKLESFLVADKTGKNKLHDVANFRTQGCQMLNLVKIAQRCPWTTNNAVKSGSGRQEGQKGEYL